MRHFLTGLSIAVLSVGLSACDQQDARKERAGKLFDAVITQLENSENPGGPSALERATPEERAVFGQLANAPEVQIASESSRIAVGSIIAKPRTVEQMQAVVRAKSRSIAPGVSARSAPSDGGGAPQGIQEPAPPVVFSSPEYRELT